jgi:putative transposase
MRKSRYTDAQIAFALKQAELGTSVAEVCRKMGVAEATFFRWKQKFSGLGPSELRKLRQLEEENAKLKKLVADLSLDKAMLQEVLAKTYGPPRLQEVSRSCLISLRQRIRSQGGALAKMEIRAPRSS